MVSVQLNSRTEEKRRGPFGEREEEGGKAHPKELKGRKVRVRRDFHSLLEVLLSKDPKHGTIIVVTRSKISLDFKV